MISPAHLQAFSKQQRQRFEDEMVAHLKRAHPTESKKLADPGLRDLIRQGIDKAKGHHIVLEPDVARYIEMMLTVSPDFDKSKGVAEILKRRRLSGLQKMTSIEQILPQTPAAEALS
jgi:hypothetical protein